ncbi:hypothetical protein GCM10022262_40720 [Georgenia daeguensis]|uniref:Flavoprotein domain-containing protein n=1 Tax=Georgenia daeguensis TaxID=908355 RepID=A0ABP6UPS6_9MICO
MDERELRGLIRQIVSDMLQPRRGQNALVLFSGASLGFEAALGSLARLAPEMGLDWIQTPAAEHILDQDAIAASGMTPANQSLVQAHDVLIVPTATVNLLAKVAHGVCDCLASNVMAEFIMSNKPVVVAVNAACPDSADKRGWFPDIPPGYRDLLRGNLERVRSFGVRLTSAEQLDRAVRRQLTKTAALPGGDATQESPVIRCTEPVVHEALLRAVPPGTVLQLEPAALITPLARETAAARSIAFERVS